MSKKNIFASILAVIILAGGVYAGVMLVKEQQELREKAAVPGGEARVSLFPTSGSFSVGDSLPVSVYFNTSGIAISSIRLRLIYPFTGTSPEIVASNIEINPVIEGSGNWTCPTRSVTTEGQNIAIDIGCWNNSAMGFSTSTDTLLATFDMVVERIPQTNPFSLSFDKSQSVIVQLSNGADILNIPDNETGIATFTVNTETDIPSTSDLSPVPTKTPTPSPTATSAVKITTIPTKTPTPSPTRVLTVTPTRTLTPTPASLVELPDAGLAAPTYIGVGLGLTLIIFAILLVF